MVDLALRKETAILTSITFAFIVVVVVVFFVSFTSFFFSFLYIYFFKYFSSFVLFSLFCLNNHLLSGTLCYGGKGPEIVYCFFSSLRRKINTRTLQFLFLFLFPSLIFSFFSHRFDLSKATATANQVKL